MKKLLSTFLLLLLSIATYAQISKIGASDAIIISNNVQTRGVATRGVVFMASDENMPNQLLGFTDSGDFDPSNMPDNMRYWLGLYEEEIENWQLNGLRFDQKRPQTRAGHTDVAPFVTALWNQYGPYNNFCPTYKDSRTLTGCVATAMSEIMYTFKYPDAATGEIDYTTSTLNIPISANLAEYEFDWANMLPEYTNDYSQRQADAVAKLIYAAGVSVNMNYRLDGSSASSRDAAKALVNNFFYDNDIRYIDRSKVDNDDWNEILISALEKHQPILFSGKSPNSGHAFVFDGVQFIEGEPYYHVNWGWGGYGNGYFRLNNMQPTNSNNGPYNDNQGAVFGICPEDGVTEYESMITATDISLSSSHITTGDTSDMNIIMTEITNSLNRKFIGKVKYYLVNGNEEYCLGSLGFNMELDMGYYYPSLNYTVSIPEGLPEGEYRLEVRSIAEGGTKEQRVLTGNGQQIITVSETMPANNANIMATSYSVEVKDNNISLSANNIMNYGDGTFSGKIMMALADDNGYILDRFGSELNCSGLSHFSSYTYAQGFSGDLPNDIANGTYRIYLVANQEGTEGWNKLSGFKLANNTIIEYGTELYAKIVVSNGIAELSDENLPEYYANIQVTDLSLTSFDKETNSFTVSASQICNFGDTDFVGKISLAIKDSQGNYHTFGNPFKVGQSLGHFSYYTVPQNIDGTLNEVLADGPYKLVLVAKQDGCRGWSELKKFELANNYITSSGAECAISLWVVNGAITFDAPTFTLAYYVDDQEYGNEQVAWGAKISLIDAPTREGYTFSGWSGYPEDLIMPDHDVRIDGTFTKDPVLVSSITLNQTSFLIEVGQSVQLKAIIAPDDADKKDVVWKSSNENVVKVSNNGLVTYVGRGRATVTAETTDGSNLSASCEFFTKWVITYMVDDAEYKTMEMAPGENIVLIDAPTREGYTFSGWSGYPEDLIMPDHDVRIDGTFTKDPVLVSSIKLNATTLSLEVGETFQFETSVAPSDADNKEISWSSSDVSVATVTNTGLVTIIAQGTAIITAEAMDGSGTKATCTITGYNDISSILNDSEAKEIYTIDGNKASSSARGLIIVKDKNGKTKKVMKK